MSIAVAQTPQRPLPGAYIATPAANRIYQTGAVLQPNFQQGQVAAQRQYDGQGQNTAVAQQAQQSGHEVGRPASEELRPIQRAARTINETLKLDFQYPDLDSYISQGPSSDYDVTSQPAWAPFQKVKTYNMPDTIFEQYNNAQLSTMMGLFADLNHAWVTIDNSFYMWDYTHPKPDLIGFEEQPHSITAVRLVTPRPGVFLPSITRLLVVATTANIMLVGLASQTTPGGGNSVSLYSTRLEIPLKGMTVNIIEGSAATGRIFFSENAGDDVYELTYQQEDRWFQSRCAKINHTGKNVTAFSPGPIFGFGQKPQHDHVTKMAVDDTRGLLYTLSSRSTIRIFHLNPNNGLSHTITKSLAATLNDIGHMPNLQTDLLSPNISIISIDPISSREAYKIHLMVTTSTGCRIFYSATSANSRSSFTTTSTSNAPTSLQVHHVKFPPSDQSRPVMDRSVSTQMITYGNGQTLHTTSRALLPTRKAVRFSPGFFFCFVPRDQNNDSLFISAPDTGRIARFRENPGFPKFPELALRPHLGSRCEDIGLVSPPIAAYPSPNGFGNETAIQYDSPVAEVAILTNSGVHTYRRRRLVDMFASDIKSGGADDGFDGEIKKFLRLYGPSETAATSLAVACGQGLDVSVDSRVAKITDPVVLDFARKAFIEHGGKPRIVENQMMDSSAPTVDSVRPSPRHDGLSLYISRLVRSIWGAPIVQETLSPATGLVVLPAVSLSKLHTISQDLLTLKEFLDSNKSFIDGLAGPDALGRVSTKQDEIVLQAEHRALHSLVILVENIIEGIAFVQVLFDEQISEIVASLPGDVRQQVRHLNYEGLFSSANGKDLAKELVKAIVNRNIASGSNVETVAEALRRRCGSFCSADDVVIFKAQEMLKRASEAGAKSESGRNLLNESLRLFKQVAGSLTMEQLRWAVQSFTNMQFYAGAIQLALDVAHEADRSNRALAWIQEGRPQNDPKSSAFESRKRCYDLIHEVVNSLDQASLQGIDNTDGQHTLSTRRRTEAYEVIDTSEDEAFHTDLYDWYLSQGRTERLLDIQSPYIITYLQRKSVDDVTIADLLWRYHTQRGYNHEAAIVQLELAQSSFPLSLDQRIEYLGRAKANASTTSLGIARQTRYQLLREVSDLLDVANIQSDILQRCKADKRIKPEHWPIVLKELNGTILPFDTLFNKYADQAGHFDLCLLIYNAADHRNPQDIKNTWQNLLDRTHEDTLHRGEPQPYEAIIEKVRSLGQALNLSETMFPISDLVPLLERYAFEFQNGVGPEHWVLDTLIDIGVPFESLYAILEAMFYNDEAPFHGKNRRYIANEILYVVGLWSRDFARGAGEILGGESSAATISATLLALQPMLGAQKSEECQMLRLRIEHMLR